MSSSIISDRINNYIKQIEGALPVASPFVLLVIPIACQAGWWRHYNIPVALFDMSFFMAGAWMTIYTILACIFFMAFNYVLDAVEKIKNQQWWGFLFIPVVAIYCLLFSGVLGLMLSGLTGGLISFIISVISFFSIFIALMLNIIKEHLDGGEKIRWAVWKLIRGARVGPKQQSNDALELQDYLLTIIIVVVSAFSVGGMAGWVNDRINNNDGQTNLVVANVGGLTIRSGNGTLSIKPNSEQDSY